MAHLAAWRISRQYRGCTHKTADTADAERLVKARDVRAGRVIGEPETRSLS
jgi:hypothetical protein